jgi:alkylhydroperoxidase family enzyme
MPNITMLDIYDGSADYQTSARFSDAEKRALRYSQRMALDPDKIDAAFYDALRRHYTDEEIDELGAFIAFHHGMQVFARTLRMDVP